MPDPRLAPPPGVHPPLPASNSLDEPHVPWTGLALVLAITGLIFFMAVPGRPLDAAEQAAQRFELELRLALGELRGALSEYHDEHGTWPGDDLQGSVVPGQLVSPLFGSCLPDGVPRNPLNGSSGVLVLRHDERMPEGPTGSAGWIYSPSTGELRANVPGHLVGAGLRVFDL